MTHSTQIPNRLINENSPYLLQHANNPVDWWPWCDEAFAKAKAENKPVFLSIGYSTCHWCHVMAHESFENAQVAALLNEYFIPVKVDREQRPDVDSVYMSVCQGLSGQGGWPLTVLTTPQQQPFYTATYVPPAQLMQLAERIGEEWREDAQRLWDTARRVSAFFAHRQQETPAAPPAPDAKLPQQAYLGLSERFDKQNGGFGGAPKFPLPHNLLFLLEWHQQEGDEKALTMATHSLDMMYRGGIFDHAGGGFARYATDDRWLIPHFEKMLYDNALLLWAYAEAYRVTAAAHYRQVALSIVDWLLAEMASEGAYYAAQDADSEGGEGAYYIWREQEIDAALGKEAAAFKAVYDVTARGNFEGANILNLLSCESWQETDDAIRGQLKALYQIRRARMALHTDDKILTGWNALLLAALARAAGALNEPRLLTLAENLWRHIETRLIGEDGRPLAGQRAGQSLGEGRLDDVAFLLMGLLELYEAQGAVDGGLLRQAEALARQLKEYFWDEAKGGFFLSASDAERLIFRPKDYYDGAIPSGNAVAAYGLAKLERHLPGAGWRNLALRALAAAGIEAQQYPAGYCFAMLCQLKLTPHA